VHQCALDGVQDAIQVLTEVFGKEADHEIPAFLERGILAAVAPVGPELLTRCRNLAVVWKKDEPDLVRRSS